MAKLLTFKEALAKSDENRHLLLGNGFSIDWNKGIFTYGALTDQADFSKLSVDSKKLFNLLETKDFEVVIDALRKSTALSKLYTTTDTVLSKKFAGDAKKLKEILATTVAKSHPDQLSAINKSEYKFCRRFLANFRKIYTLNYDLLLYWVLMHEEGSEKIKCDDGFRDSEDDSAGFVVWNNGKSHNQTIFYLHGALHLFDAGTDLQKYTWKKTGIRLIDQVRNALGMELFPLIVTEGTSGEKITRINHSGYLHKARRSFEEIGGSLFIHGHALADNDDHILLLVPESKINKVFVSFTLDPEDASNEAKVLKLQRMVEKRKGILDSVKSKKEIARKALEIYYYKAETARVWR